MAGYRKKGKKLKNESLTLIKWIFMNGRRELMKNRGIYGEEGKQMKVSSEVGGGKNGLCSNDLAWKSTELLSILKYKQ